MKIDSIQNIPEILDTMRKSYDLSIDNLQNFISKVTSQTKDLTEFNKVSRIQRIKVMVNKY